MSTSFLSSRTSLAVLLAITLVGPHALGQTPSAVDIAVAKKLFAQAEEDEAAERWAAALDKLKRVLAIKETAGVRFHLALAEERLGQLMTAREDYKRSAALAQKLPPAEAAPLVDQATTAIARLDTRLPTVTVTVPEVKGVTVRVDGKDLPPAQFGRPAMHDLGEISVDASAPGRQPFSKRMVLIERNVITIEITLPEAVEAAAGPLAPPPATPPATPPPPRNSVVAPVILVGGAVVFGGVSVFGLMLVMQKRERRSFVRTFLISL